MLYDNPSILKMRFFCGYLYKQGKDGLLVLATYIFNQVSSWLVVHAETILFALLFRNIISFSIFVFIEHQNI